MKFREVDLAEELQTNLEKIGFVECTPVQNEAIPAALEGKDISALAQTGTGKTAAFLLPLMDRILKSTQGYLSPESQSAEEIEKRSKRVFKDWKKGHFALILVPTRELAEQVYQDFYKFRGELTLEAVSVYGGTEYEDQRKKLSQGVQFVIGTPGRLIDLYKTHSLDLRQVRAVVFDEADRMFDMGFKDDMKFLLQRIPKDRQILLFSATMNFDVIETAYRFGSEPVEFNLSKDQAKAENVEDSIFHVGQSDKPKYVLSLVKKINPTQAIIFSNFKSNVDRIAKFLSKNGVPAVGISSLLTQAQRNRVISMFKEGTGRNILVATDVAARGLDIKNVDLVLNYELPDDPENYVHRIGRTGRAGASGKAFSLVSDRDVDALVRIQDYLKHKLEVGWIDDNELISEFEPMPYDEDRKPRFAREGEGQRPRGPGGPRGHGDRPRGPRGSGDRRPDRSSGPRQHARPQQGQGTGEGAPRGPRPQGERRPQGDRRPHGEQRHDRGHQNGAHKSAHSHPKKHSPRPHSQFKRRPLAPKKEAGIIGKVTGFLKGLFGEK